MDLTQLLTEMESQGASDLHLTVGQPPIYRVNGKLVRRQEGPLLDASLMEEFLLPHLSVVERAHLTEARQNVEKTLRLRTLRFRLHVFYERGRLAAALRLLSTHVPTLDELGLGKDSMPVFQEIIGYPRGLVLVVGETGSGKSTLCASLIEEINQTRAERIYTVEDPIEFEFESKQSVITQSTVGEDVPSFPAGLRTVIHADPDVVLVGETRDLETMSLTLSLAETGHLVFSTLHVASASGAVQRLIEAYPQPQRDIIRRLVAQTLVAVIAQKLVLRKEGGGRVPLQEVLLTSPRVRQMIAEGQTDLRVAIEAGRPLGMQTMDDALARLYEQDKISYETAWLNLEDKGRITRQAVAT